MTKIDELIDIYGNAIVGATVLWVKDVYSDEKRNDNYKTHGNELKHSLLSDLLSLIEHSDSCNVYGTDGDSRACDCGAIKHKQAIGRYFNES